MLKARRKKKCKVCRDQFKPFNTIQATCLKPSCILEYNQMLTDKRERRRLRADRLRIKPRGKWMQEAQTAFNAYIRLRDEAEPCISCGIARPPKWVGGLWDCGHYLTIGAHPELRFEELNAHKQCKKCNGGSGRFTRKGRTVQQDYRDRLIVRIGLKAVQWLEGPHLAKKYTIEQLRAMKGDYQQKARELKRCRD